MIKIKFKNSIFFQKIKIGHINIKNIINKYYNITPQIK